MVRNSESNPSMEKKHGRIFETKRAFTSIIPDQITVKPV